jgi:hypothetical protein
MDNIHCDGTEKTLADCRFDGWNVNNCNAEEAAGVICDVDKTTTTSTTTELAPAAGFNKQKNQIRVYISDVRDCILVIFVMPGDLIEPNNVYCRKFTTKKNKTFYTMSECHNICFPFAARFISQTCISTNETKTLA